MEAEASKRRTSIHVFRPGFILDMNTLRRPVMVDVRRARVEHVLVQQAVCSVWIDNFFDAPDVIRINTSAFRMILEIQQPRWYIRLFFYELQRLLRTRHEYVFVFSPREFVGRIKNRRKCARETKKVKLFACNDRKKLSNQVENSALVLQILKFN